MSTFAFNHRLEKVYMCAVKDDLSPSSKYSKNQSTTTSSLHCGAYLVVGLLKTSSHRTMRGVCLSMWCHPWRKLNKFRLCESHCMYLITYDYTKVELCTTLRYKTRTSICHTNQIATTRFVQALNRQKKSTTLYGSPQPKRKTCRPWFMTV